MDLQHDRHRTESVRLRDFGCRVHGRCQRSAGVLLPRGLTATAQRRGRGRRRFALIVSLRAIPTVLHASVVHEDGAFRVDTAVKDCLEVLVGDADSFSVVFRAVYQSLLRGGLLPGTVGARPGRLIRTSTGQLGMARGGPLSTHGRQSLLRHGWKLGASWLGLCIPVLRR